MLHKAAMDGCPGAVKILLDKGAKIGNDRFYTKVHIGVTTPLGIAARFGHTDVVKLLIERGADVNLRGGNGNGPRWGAAYFGDRKLAEFFVEKGAAVNPEKPLATPLEGAVENGQAVMIDWLVKKGATPSPPSGTPAFSAGGAGAVDSGTFISFVAGALLA